MVMGKNSHYHSINSFRSSFFRREKELVHLTVLFYESVLSKHWIDEWVNCDLCNGLDKRKRRDERVERDKHVEEDKMFLSC